MQINATPSALALPVHLVEPAPAPVLVTEAQRLARLRSEAIELFPELFVSQSLQSTVMPFVCAASPPAFSLNANNEASLIYAYRLFAQESEVGRSALDYYQMCVLPKAPCLHAYQPIFNGAGYDLNIKLDLNAQEIADLHAAFPAGLRSQLEDKSVEHFILCQAFNKDIIDYAAGRMIPLQIKPQHWLSANFPTSIGPHTEGFECTVDVLIPIHEDFGSWAKEDEAAVAHSLEHRIVHNAEHFSFPLQPFVVQDNACLNDACSLFLSTDMPAHAFFSLVVCGDRAALTYYSVYFRSPLEVPPNYCLSEKDLTKLLQYVQEEDEDSLQAYLKTHFCKPYGWDALQVRAESPR